MHDGGPLSHFFHAEARRARVGPSVRASCSCLASLVVCVPEAGASQVTCWRSRTRTVTGVVFWECLVCLYHVFEKLNRLLHPFRLLDMLLQARVVMPTAWGGLLGVSCLPLPRIRKAEPPSPPFRLLDMLLQARVVMPIARGRLLRVSSLVSLPHVLITDPPFPPFRLLDMLLQARVVILVGLMVA